MNGSPTLRAISLLVPKRSIFFFICLTIVVGITESLAVLAIVPFISVVSGGEVTAGPFQSLFSPGAWNTDELLLATGFIALAALISRNVLAATALRYQLRLVASIGDRLSRALLVSYLSRPYSFFLQRDSTELTKNILSEASMVATGVASPAMQLVAYSLISAMIFGVVLVASPLLGSALTGMIAFGYGLIHLISRRRMDRLGKERLQANSRRFAAAGEAIRGLRELRLLGQEESFIADFSKPSSVFAERSASIQTAANLPRFLLEVFVLASVVMLVIWTGTGEQGGGGRALPILALYTLAAYRLLPALQQIYASYSSLRAHRSNAALILTDLQASDTSSEQGRGLRLVNFPSSIQMKAVSFSYPSRDPTLTNLSWSLPLGKVIGLSGPSGSGKSTLVHLLTGLLSPSSGSIHLDGLPLTDYRLGDWFTFLGYVPQETYIASTTVRSNIALGETVDLINESRLIQAVKHAALDEILDSKEDGLNLDTPVGEQGTRLSGGQRQRIGIARALYKNPALLVLDEATSGIDQKTESRILDTLRRERSGITVLLITHRMATIRQCDTEFRLIDGRLIQKGPFDSSGTS